MLGRFCYITRAMVKGGNRLTRRLQVSVEDDAIVVRLAGTDHCISYRKTYDALWLVASEILDDPKSRRNRLAFRAQAWTAANEKARELGWIV
jgi:hypothetical protein